MKLDEVQDEHSQLQAALEEKQLQAKDYFQEIEIVMRECDELEEEIKMQNKLQSAAREEAVTLKKQANDLKDAVATAQWALEQAEAEEENLRAQVVSSPDRRKSERLLRQERLQQVKQECANVEAAVKTTKTKIANAQQAAQNLEAVTALLDDLRDEAWKHQETLRRMDETRKQCTATAKQTTELHKQMDEAQRRLERAQAKIVQQRKQHEMQIAAVDDALMEAKNQLLRVERERREGMARIEAGDAVTWQVDLTNSDVPFFFHFTAIHQFSSSLLETEDWRLTTLFPSLPAQNLPTEPFEFPALLGFHP